MFVAPSKKSEWSIKIKDTRIMTFSDHQSCSYQNDDDVAWKHNTKRADTSIFNTIQQHFLLKWNTIESFFTYKKINYENLQKSLVVDKIFT